MKPVLKKVLVMVLMTYVPDDNFEQTLIDLGYDDTLDDYVNTSSISGVKELRNGEWAAELNMIFVWLCNLFKII